jgi:2-polyprenyl-3-methyl-5-hydroxy-6-metoxy-1,4-benzoquinol methylase
MSKFLTDILADPMTGEKLSDHSGILENNAGHQYWFENGIPDFISGLGYQPAVSPLHSAEGTWFYYREHYVKDAQYFDYSAGDDSVTTRNERQRNREAILNVIPQNINLVLDIGCGDAWIAKELLKKKGNVVSMDLAITNPLNAIKNYPSENHAAVVADGMYLPFIDNCFDVIVASEVIEHLADPAAFIRHCTVKLKPGGKLILLTPYNEKLEFYICVHCNKPTPKSAHLHSFTEKFLEQFKNYKIKTEVLCNKYLVRLRIYDLLSFLPFNLWRIIDSIVNKIFGKPSTLLVVIVK